MIPVAPWPLRLPIIRHIRALILTYRINRHYAFWRCIAPLAGWSQEERDWVDAIMKGHV